MAIPVLLKDYIPLIVWISPEFESLFVGKGMSGNCIVKPFTGCHKGRIKISTLLRGSIFIRKGLTIYSLYQIMPSEKELKLIKGIKKKVMNHQSNKTEIVLKRKESKSIRALNRVVETNKNTFFFKIIWF